MSFINDVLDNISGANTQENYQAQLDMQAQQNQMLLDLQKQQLALENTPEAIRARTIKYVLVFVGFACVLGFVFLYFKYFK